MVLYVENVIERARGSDHNQNNNVLETTFIRMLFGRDLAAEFAFIWSSTGGTMVRKHTTRFNSFD